MLTENSTSASIDASLLLDVSDNLNYLESAYRAFELLLGESRDLVSSSDLASLVRCLNIRLSETNQLLDRARGRGVVSSDDEQ